MSGFRFSNLYAGTCESCKGLVPKGAGSARHVGNGRWVVKHSDCGAPAPRPKPAALTPLNFIKDYPDRHQYGEELGLSDLPPKATHPQDIAYHLACVLNLAQEFRISE